MIQGKALAWTTKLDSSEPALRKGLTVRRTDLDIGALQRSAGNLAVGALLDATRLQRADAGPAAPTAASSNDAGTPSDKSADVAVDALDLQSNAKAIAKALKTKFPSISFTSGKRSDVSDQARAMAGNVVSNRQWITETYRDKSLAKELQDWLNANPKKTTKDDIAAGLAGVMGAWDSSKKGRLSAHYSGEAFDIQPQSDKATQIKTEASTLAKAKDGQFLESEGGLVRWHLQVRG